MITKKDIGAGVAMFLIGAAGEYYFDNYALPPQDNVTHAVADSTRNNIRVTISNHGGKEKYIELKAAPWDFKGTDYALQESIKKNKDVLYKQ